MDGLTRRLDLSQRPELAAEAKRTREELRVALQNVDDGDRELDQIHEGYKLRQGESRRIEELEEAVFAEVRSAEDAVVKVLGRVRAQAYEAASRDLGSQVRLLSQEVLDLQTQLARTRETNTALSSSVSSIRTKGLQQFDKEREGLLGLNRELQEQHQQLQERVVKLEYENLGYGDKLRALEQKKNEQIHGLREELDKWRQFGQGCYAQTNRRGLLLVRRWSKDRLKLAMGVWKSFVFAHQVGRTVREQLNAAARHREALFAETLQLEKKKTMKMRGRINQLEESVADMSQAKFVWQTKWHFGEEAGTTTIEADPLYINAVTEALEREQPLPLQEEEGGTGAAGGKGYRVLGPR